MANGEVIDQVRDLLKNPKGMTNKTAQIMTLTLLSELHEKWAEDHAKMEALWPAYIWGRWVVIVIAGLGLTDIVTRVLAMIGGK